MNFGDIKKAYKKLKNKGEADKELLTFIHEAIKQADRGDDYDTNAIVAFLAKIVEWTHQSNNFELLELVIDKNGLNVDARIVDSFMLRHASDIGNHKIVELLIPISDVNARMSQALDVAIRNHRLEVASLLIPHTDLETFDHYICLRLVSSLGGMISCGDVEKAESLNKIMVKMFNLVDIEEFKKSVKAKMKVHGNTWGGKNLKEGMTWFHSYELNRKILSEVKDNLDSKQDQIKQFKI